MNKIKSLILLIILTLGISSFLCAQKLPATNPIKAQVFVTAKDSALRLVKTSDIRFEDFGQPVQTEIIGTVENSSVA